MKGILTTCFLLLASLSYAKTVSLMQYNVENLFDTEHDEGKNDWTYLPLVYKNSNAEVQEACNQQDNDYYVKECLSLDWNANFLKKKIIAISNVVKAYDETGTGPDILVIEEVENLNVINQLIQTGLSNLGYKYVSIIEGEDERGIDVALISKFPIKSSNLYPLKGLKTRGILETEIQVGKSILTIYANHWPSQSNPVEARINSAKMLEELAQKNKAHAILAMGDFNVTAEDSPNPFSNLKNFIDTQEVARGMNPELHFGSHFYRGKWSFLDRIFVHKNSKDKVDYKSFQVIKRPFMLKKDNYTGEWVPNRFNFKTGEGFSDHLPLGLKIQL